MATVVDTMTGLIPVAMAGGIALGVSKAFLEIPTNSSKKQQAFSEIDKSEVVKAVGSAKANVLKKNPGKQFQWGDDVFMYQDGTYFIA